MEKFIKFLNDLGLEVDEPVLDGTIQRCRTAGKAGNKKNGWYVGNIHNNSIYATAGDWATGQQEKYNNGGSTTSPEVQKIFKLQAQIRKEEQEKLWARQSRKATEYCNSLQPAGSHPYLSKKQIEPYGLLQDGDQLVVPMMDPDGKITTYQKIAPDGSKKYLFGGRKTGSAFVIAGEKDKIYVCEGFATGATVHEATGKAVFCCMDTSNLKPVVDALKEIYKPENIIVAADNDYMTKEPIPNPGVTKAKEAHGKVVWPEGIKGTDFNDMACEKGIDAVRQLLKNFKLSSHSTFEFTHVSQLMRNIKPTDWLIEGFLEADALSVLFGKSASYKTFLALSWGLSIASGDDWFGYTVKQGTVFFIIGEGQNGFAKRIKAKEVATGADFSDIPFYVSKTPVMMLDAESAKSAGEAINELSEKHGEPALVVIDTLARNFGSGDENRTEDMTKFINHLDEYIGRGFHRMVVHHTGHKEDDRARGSYSLIAAADAIYRTVYEDKDNIVKLSCSKMKDGEKSPDISLKPQIVDLDDSLLPMTSVYLDFLDNSEIPKNDVKLSSKMKQAISLLELLKRDGTKSCHSCTNLWRDICVEEDVYVRGSFYNAIKSLKDKKVIKIIGDCVVLSQVS